MILAFSRAGDSRGVDLVRRCNQVGVQVDVVPRLYEVLGSKTQVHELDGLPLVSLHAPRLPRSARVVKRALDIVVAAVMLTLLSPLFAYVALRIKLEAPGPVFFRQERIGWRGRRFRIYKFRSMYIDADARKGDVGHLNKHEEDGPTMFKIPEDPRITPFGRWLRKWSVDELPQLINVLRGEMSLVGPRPLIIEEDRHIVGHGRRRLDLTPGLTGLWQVMGRSDIPFARDGHARLPLRDQLVALGRSEAARPHDARGHARPRRVLDPQLRRPRQRAASCDPSPGSWVAGRGFKPGRDRRPRPRVGLPGADTRGWVV